MGKGVWGPCTLMQMLHSAYNLQESMKFSEFWLVMEEAQQWVKQKQNDCLPPHKKYDPKIEDFLVNTFMSLSCLAGTVMNSPKRF
jgi:hypothetical protein